jgi:hypothetical protein
MCLPLGGTRSILPRSESLTLLAQLLAHVIHVLA